MRTGLRRPTMQARRRGQIRVAVALLITLLLLGLRAIECHGLAFDATANDNMQQQSHQSETAICAGDEGTCSANTASSDDNQSISSKEDAITPIYLQNMSTEELNVQATNYILSLLQHHLPTAAASIDNHLEELPLVVTLAIIVCIIVTRIVFVGILLGLIVGFSCAGPIVLVGRCCYYWSGEIVSEENNILEAIEANESNWEDDDNDEDEIDESIPRVAGEKTLRFAPVTKRSDGTRKGSNMRRRRRGRT